MTARTRSRSRGAGGVPGTSTKRAKARFSFTDSGTASSPQAYSQGSWLSPPALSTHTRSRNGGTVRSSSTAVLASPAISARSSTLPRILISSGCVIIWRRDQPSTARITPSPRSAVDRGTRALVSPVRVFLTPMCQVPAAPPASCSTVRSIRGSTDVWLHLAPVFQSRPASFRLVAPTTLVHSLAAAGGRSTSGWSSGTWSSTSASIVAKPPSAAPLPLVIRRMPTASPDCRLITGLPDIPSMTTSPSTRSSVACPFPWARNPAVNFWAW